MASINCFIKGLAMPLTMVMILVLTGVVTFIWQEYIFPWRLDLPKSQKRLTMLNEESSDLKFYFFNLTNPDEVTEHGTKPAFKEIGPYTYRIVRERENVRFFDNGDRVWFEQRTWYYFDMENSIGNDLNTFTNLDLVAYRLTKNAYDIGKIKFLIKFLIRLGRNKPFHQYTIRDFLFGYEDKLIKKSSMLAGVVQPHYNFGFLIDKTTGESLNGTINGNFTLATNETNLDAYGNVLQYNDLNNFNDVWPVEEYQNFHGKLAANLGPKLDSDSKLELFSGDTCGYQKFQLSENNDRQGRRQFRFEMDLQEWRKSTEKLNKALCKENLQHDITSCPKQGVLNITTCQGTHWLMSLPHFLAADPYYNDSVQGLEPDVKNHDSFVESIESESGLMMKQVIRLQYNMVMEPFDWNYYEYLPSFTLMPTVWIESRKISHIQSLQTSWIDKFFYITISTLLFVILFVVILAIAFVLTKKFCPSSNSRNITIQNNTNSCLENVPLKNEQI